MKTNRTAIRQKTDEYKEELLDFLKQLVQTPSINGKDSEEKISSLVAEEAGRLGLPYRSIALDQERPNVFVGEDFGGKSGLLFVAHLDTVPGGDESKWKHKPFGAEIEDRKLFGRGAIDCKAGIALSIYALRILKDLGRLGLAKFAGVVDEESGADSKLGARYLLDNGLNAKASIYTYSGVETVTIGHRGGVRLWIEVAGEAVHTGSLRWQKKEKGANAIEALSQFIGLLKDVKMEGKNPSFPGFGFVATPTLIEGGNGESIVPDKGKVLIDARLLPNQDNNEYIEKVRQLAKRLETNKIKFSVSIKNNIQGVVISPKEKIVRILDGLDKEVMGIKPEIRGCGPWNEGYMFIAKGIPTICGFGAVGDGAHSTDEYVEIGSLPQILEIYVRAALELAS
ncbi:MAG: Acetylornithine deacetylase or succinyl-diaminopimelate desuccinylase [Candidatus Woesebacteria bacterium GW2011_GWC2_45_9]|uniref:Acetylornithine deacetylase or succinyl-diaminopimelate desuccinylase n=2 Tax=Microgenomates group TaxID=1794810 RepID=A0A0G1NAI0_9BACT|nr:MAG: Peptidase, M20/M25/M40 superfamily protein [Candidatus Curtissbacteria bacterium GW2011_GWC1_44_33]KKU17521.1 MAG: Acetylornithine deacetylase or succinyl-diaminopimelate desuccinylase [Candidatus Woesebacteria bacterium GW2011_GWC2_45_9]